MQARAAKAICVGNIKGGVGKSTLTVYLADFCAIGLSAATL